MKKANPLARFLRETAQPRGELRQIHAESAKNVSREHLGG
jgi:hypothetical protein